MSKKKNKTLGKVLPFIIIITILIAVLGLILRCGTTKQQLTAPILAAENTEVEKGEEVVIRWSQSKNADYYNLYIEHNNQTQTVTYTETAATLRLSETGSYKLYVVAKGDDKEDSPASNVLEIMCVISVQSIEMNETRIIFWSVEDEQ